MRRLPRSTVRRLMVAVAVVAIPLGSLLGTGRVEVWVRQESLGKVRWIIRGSIKGTAQIAVEISFKGFWAVSLALKAALSNLQPAQGLRRSRG
jgi:hypothetical protein